MTARIVSFIIALFAVSSTALSAPAEVSRVLRSFDFEERRLGNVEELPMNWAKIDGAGMPHYVNGLLATDRSRSGRYSFKLGLNGGSLAYRYQPGPIKVQPDAHYRVDGFVQTTKLAHARARMSAYFTDLDGHIIESSRRSSQLVGNDSDDPPTWQALSIELTASDPASAFLVIEVGLLQPSAYAAAQLGERTLYPQDIYGAAWFDDISVSQVPQVVMSTDRPGNIFRLSDARRLTVTVNDRFTDDLAAQLIVRDAAGRTSYQKSGALENSSAEILGPGRKRLTLTLPSELPAGWYEAALEMSSQGQFVGKHKLDFILLADDAKPTAPDARFGLIATDLAFDGWTELPAILPLLSAGRVKLGVWSEAGDVQQLDASGFDRLLDDLQDQHITTTACLLTLPPSVRDKMKVERPLRPDSSFDTGAVLASASENPWLTILKTPRETWQPTLAYLIARHANHLQRWQIGADGSDAFVSDPRMRQVYREVYTEFEKLVQHPDLAMPWPAWYELDGEMPATVALHVKPDVLPNQLPLYMADIVKGGASGAESSSTASHRSEPLLSVFLQPLDSQQYGREVQIRDLAQRIAYALSADAKRIDIKLPYDVTRIGEGVSKHPQELFLVVRTILRTLSNATFKGKVPIAEGVEAFLFDRNGEGVLMLWDRGAGERGTGGVKQLALNLGRRPACLDLWGNVTPLLRTTSSASGTVPLELGAMPIFLVGVDAQLMQLRASITFDNDRIESSFKAHTRHLRFTNPYHSAIAGTVKLTPPKGWTINPPSHTFTLNPGETLDREITIEFPYNTFAGTKIITADFQFQGEVSENFSVPLALKLGLSDVGLQTVALRDGEDVIVQQMITNYGEKPIDYTAYAMYPGQARQERLVTKLAPGRTTIKKYRFVKVNFSKDAAVRSGVKELIGTRVLNDEVAIQ